MFWEVWSRALVIYTHCTLELSQCFFAVQVYELFIGHLRKCEGKEG